MKPLLAAKAPDDLSTLNYPIMVSPKLDGIRCLIVDGEAVSRTLKPIPNKFIRQTLAGLPDFDGELMTNGDFNDVQSAVMREEGTPDFVYRVFDWMNDQPFKLRYQVLEQQLILLPVKRRVQLVPHTFINNAAQLLEYHAEQIKAGYEGTMIRDPNGPYKFGRSTQKQGILLKLKDFLDDEATITGFKERMHNGNEAKKNALGRTERSTSAENMVPMGTLGAFIVDYNGHTLAIGTGMDDAQRQHFWDLRDNLYGQKVNFKYQNLSKDGIPRFPVFQHIREVE